MILRDFNVEEGSSGQAVLPRWPWSEALATARPGGRYRLARIPSSLARTRLRELGFAEGTVVVCAGNRAGYVRLENETGHTLRLERGLAWFVQVEVLGASGMTSN